jgi:hypothetical protein
VGKTGWRVRDKVAFHARAVMVMVGKDCPDEVVKDARIAEIVVGCCLNLVRCILAEGVED